MKKFKASYLVIPFVYCFVVLMILDISVMMFVSKRSMKNIIDRSDTVSVEVLADMQDLLNEYNFTTEEIEEVLTSDSLKSITGELLYEKVHVMLGEDLEFTVSREDYMSSISDSIDSIYRKRGEALDNKTKDELVTYFYNQANTLLSSSSYKEFIPTADADTYRNSVYQSLSSGDNSDVKDVFFSLTSSFINGDFLVFCIIGLILCSIISTFSIKGLKDKLLLCIKSVLTPLVFVEALAINGAIINKSKDVIFFNIAKYTLLINSIALVLMGVFLIILIKFFNDKEKGVGKDGKDMSRDK